MVSRDREGALARGERSSAEKVHTTNILEMFAPSGIMVGWVNRDSLETR